MSLLSICAQVAGDLALPVPTSIIGNRDETATRLLATAQLAGESLARKPQGGWVSMIREYDFVTAAIAPQSGTMTVANGVGVITGLASTDNLNAYTWYAFGSGCPANSIVTNISGSEVTINQPPTQTGAGIFAFGQSNYPLPADFQRPIDDTMWDSSRYWQMRGPQSPQQWQRYKSSVIGQSSVQRRFRFRSIFNGAGGFSSGFSQGFQAGGRIRGFSIDPVPTDNGSPLVFEYVSNAWCMSGSGEPQQAWQADTDLGVVDEYLLTLGVRWRMLRRLGFSYAEELSEYESEVSKAMAHDGGAAILSIVPQGYSFLLSPWNVQEGSFPGP
jgi:hypothetical protein